MDDFCRISLMDFNPKRIFPPGMGNRSKSEVPGDVGVSGAEALLATRITIIVNVQLQPKI